VPQIWNLRRSFTCTGIVHGSCTFSIHHQKHMESRSRG